MQGLRPVQNSLSVHEQVHTIFTFMYVISLDLHNRLLYLRTNHTVRVLLFYIVKLHPLNIRGCKNHIIY